MSNKAQLPFNWPVDEEGNPSALVTAVVEETIPTAKYANVKIFNSVTRFVKDDEVKEGLTKSYDEADDVLQIKHDEIIEQLEEGNS